MTSSYHSIYQGWQADQQAFWQKAAQEIDWFKPWDKLFDANQGVYGRWFVGAECNTAYNCLDRHIEAGNGDRIALIYDSPVTGTKQKFSYHQLHDLVAQLAGALTDKGITKGDRVIIYMPMIPRAIVAMLACARIGAVHSVVFGGFAAQELATRIDDATPKAILSASCGIEPGRVIAYKPLLDEAIELASHKPEFCVISQREELQANLIDSRDYDWDAFIANATPAECVPVLATDPLYILYTSGTTGQPKGVVRDNGGHMVALKWSMQAIYGIEEGETFWAASDIGWVVGHSYIVYAPLLHGCTGILFEGKPVGTPDAGVYWRIISEYNVAALFTAPTAFRAIKKEDPEGKLIQSYDLANFRTLFLAGERADPDTIFWAEEILDRPVVDHWWQTETGWTIAGNPAGLGLLPRKAGSPAVPMPGYHIDILSDEGEILPANALGNIAIKLPLPPGAFPTLWQNEQRFVDSYLREFPGYYQTADAGYLDEDNYIYVMSRTDDIINVAGHRLSTGAMEEVLSEHEAVVEAAVVGIKDTLKGQLPAGFVVLRSGVNRNWSEIKSELVALVREKIGPVAAFRLVYAIERLPKTRSGKVLRATMRAIADGEDFKIPATIDDPAILDEIATAFHEQTKG